MESLFAKTDTNFQKSYYILLSRFNFICTFIHIQVRLNKLECRGKGQLSDQQSSS